MDRQDTINFRRLRRRTASVEGVKRCVSKSGCCATPLVSEASLSTFPRVHPSGITRGYAWCVPRWGQWMRAGRFLFSLPLPLPLSPLSTGSPFGYHPRLRMMCPRWGQWAISSPTKKNKLWRGVCFLLVAALFVALKNTIRESADAIRMSADSLIVFSNAIRIFSMAHIAAVFAYSRGF